MILHSLARLIVCPEERVGSGYDDFVEIEERNISGALIEVMNIGFMVALPSLRDHEEVSWQVSVRNDDSPLHFQVQQ